MKLGISLVNIELKNSSDYDNLINRIKSLIPFFTVFELPLSNLILKNQESFNFFTEKNKLEIYFHSRKKEKYSQSELLFILFFYKKIKCKGIIIHPLLCFQDELMKKIILNTQLIEILFLENTNDLFLQYHNEKIFKNFVLDISHYLYLNQKYINIEKVKYIHLRGYSKKKKYVRLIYSNEVIEIIKQITAQNDDVIIIFEYPYENNSQILEDYYFLFNKVNSYDV